MKLTRKVGVRSTPRGGLPKKPWDPNEGSIVVSVT